MIPGSGLSRLNFGMNSLVATRMPPCAPAAAIPTAISVIESGSTAQPAASMPSLQIFRARAGSGLVAISGIRAISSRA